MVNFFDRWYSCPDNSAFLKRVRYYSLKRFLIRRVANILIPLYFRLSNFYFKRKLRSAKKETPKIIVSLTSFPLRIKTIWIVIECLMRQQTVPDKIILWLSKDQFSGLDALPKRLLNYRDRGLEIKLREGDLRSHKKYYYMLSENENDV